MIIEITIPDSNGPADAMLVKSYLQNIAKGIDKSNLKFLADMATKSDVNKKFEKLRSNPFIKPYL